MKLNFLGTRGYIDVSTPRHARHTAMRVTYRGKSVLVDCGEDWHQHLSELAPKAIVLTHAHPDHAAGLIDGAPCPVYATQATWDVLEKYPIEQRRRIDAGNAQSIRGIQFEAFEVEHSLRCPAVGYRITAGRVTVFYCPDVVYIHERQRALEGARLYIGDGATIKQSFVRKQGERLIGHAPIQTQLTWCQKTHVPEAVITHCGTQIVSGDERTILAQLRDLARERGVEVSLAHDGMERILR